MDPPRASTSPGKSSGNGFRLDTPGMDDQEYMNPQVDRLDAAASNVANAV